MEYLYIHEISISFIDGLEYIYIYVYKGNEACTVVLQLTGITEARRRGEERRSEGRSRVHYGVLIRKIASSFSVLSSIPAARRGERERKEWGKARANTRIGRRGSDPFLKIYVKQDGAFPLLECIRFDGREQSSPRTVSGFLVLVGKENVTANGPYKYLELRR